MAKLTKQSLPLIICVHKMLWKLLFKTVLFSFLGQYGYEVLNLTQDHQQLRQQQQQQQQQIHHHGLQQQQQLHQGLQQQQQQQYPAFIQNPSLEVGLNLSLQKSYASQQQHHQSQQQQQQQQNGYYGHFENGYTFSVQMGAGSGQVIADNPF